MSPRTIIGNFTPLASTFASSERVERLKAHGEQLKCQNCHKEPICCQDDQEERQDEERENDRDRKKAREGGGIFVTTDVKRDQTTPCHSRLVGSRNQTVHRQSAAYTNSGGTYTHLYTPSSFANHCSQKKTQSQLYKPFPIYSSFMLVRTVVEMPSIPGILGMRQEIILDGSQGIHSFAARAYLE